MVRAEGGLKQHVVAISVTEAISHEIGLDKAERAVVEAGRNTS